jgi:hypothetical protein
MTKCGLKLDVAIELVNCNFYLLSWNKFCANFPTIHIALQLLTHVGCECECSYRLSTIVMTAEPSALADHYLSHSCGQYLKHSGNGPGKRQRRKQKNSLLQRERFELLTAINIKTVI